MTTRRNRRAAPPDERVYTEEDYAAPNPPGLSGEEVAYAQQMDWIPEDAAEYVPEEQAEPLLPEEVDEPLWSAEPEVTQPDLMEEEPYIAFQEAGYDPMYDSEIDYMDDGNPLDDDLLTEEEQAELRRSQWQLLSNLGDLAGIILGTATILLLVMLLVSLLNWLVGDLSQSFTLLQKNF